MTERWSGENRPVGSGTNYYLYGTTDPCPTCGHRRALDKVLVGKATVGWVFLWRGYRGPDAEIPGRELSSPDQWWAYLEEQAAAGAVIRDQYGEAMDLDELRALVALRAEPLVTDGLPPRRHYPRRPDTVNAGDSDVSFAAFT